MTEVRPLRLHDLPFAYRLAGHGVSFDAHISLTVSDDGFRQALMAGTGQLQVYVLRQPNSGGLAQLHFLASTQVARLAYVAPALGEGANQNTWLAILDGLLVMAGERGVVTLIAEVNEKATELPLLRRAGFAMYAHQDIWKRPPAASASSDLSLRLVKNGEDEHAAMGLYHSLVPGLIKHVEPPPTQADACYILDGRRGVQAVIAAYEGAHAVLSDVYLAADAETAPEQVMLAAVEVLKGDSRPIYCRVRDYMGCRAGVLENIGFDYVFRHAVMYRHTAARIAQRAFSRVEKIEGGMPLPNTFDNG